MQQLSEREARVCRAIEAKREFLLGDLRRHVEIPTGMSNPSAIEEERNIFTTRLAKLGASISLVPGQPKDDWLTQGEPVHAIPSTAVCHRLHQPGTRARVLLAGHLDTVHDPDGEFQKLTIAPDGKTAVGPGCVDMKGGLVIAVAALEALEECGVAASWGFTLNADEETGTYHSDATLRKEAAGFDVGIALEPALPGGELAIERPGSGQFMIETRGRAAHVGRAFTEGVSAVTALAECLVKVAKMPQPERGMIASVGPLEGGATTNAVPDRARGWGNVRFMTPEIGHELGQMLDALATDDKALPRVIVKRSFHRPSKPLTPGTQALALMARGAAEDLGQKLPFAKTGGVCDGNNLQAAGLPTIDTLGVRGGGLHTPTEWIELASLVERCQLLAVLISRLSERGLVTPAE